MQARTEVMSEAGPEEEIVPVMVSDGIAGGRDQLIPRSIECKYYERKDCL